MTSLDVQTTWTVQVPVEQLGAHLEAYVNAQPVIKTLRLCQHFGKGEKAAVTRLPAELLATIEGFLVEEDRGQLLREWGRHLKCHEARCRPLDHVPPERWRETYDANFFELDLAEELGGKDEHNEPGDELDPNEVEDLNNILETALEDTWLPDHCKRKLSWQERVGKHTHEDRGFFTTHKQLMTQHFGLEALVSHSQLHEPKEGQKRTDTVFATKESRLLYPSKKTHQDLHRRFIDDELEYDLEIDMVSYLPTESVLAVPITSTTLSAKAMSRFRHAMKTLGLEQTDKPKAQKSGRTNDHGLDAAIANAQCPSQRACEDKVHPNLMVLIKHIDVPEDI